MSCQVHLSATIKGLMKNGGAVLVIREIQLNTYPVVWFCTCRLAAEFHVTTIAENQDEPFSIFRIS